MRPSESGSGQCRQFRRYRRRRRVRHCRREFRRRRSLPKDWLEERFAAALADGSLYRLLGNPRLASFSASVLEEGARLDFTTLKLE